MKLAPLVESLLFASPAPLSTETLVRLLLAEEESSGLDETEAVTRENVEAAIAAQNLSYEEHGQAFLIEPEAGGWRLLTRPEFAPWVNQLFPEAKPGKLSPAALETLAIIAFRQPATKAEIETIRGVSVDGILPKLIDRGLVESGGTSEQPGHPHLYQTTSAFLEHFGIGTLEELPHADELRTLPLDGSASLPGRDDEDSATPSPDEEESSPPRQSLVAAARARAEAESGSSSEPSS
ncbi:MAG: SMC-Scp complex subunit ScpB [Verrucomicrobiota bacterium]